MTTKHRFASYLPYQYRQLFAHSCPHCGAMPPGIFNRPKCHSCGHWRSASMLPARLLRDLAIFVGVVALAIVAAMLG